MSIIEKQIATLLPGDIVLHPIFRPDGLILITRYKTITSSILHHLKVHCDQNFPVLVVQSPSELNEFVQTSYFQEETFINQLRRVHEKHRVYFGSQIPFESYTEYVNLPTTSNSHQVTPLLGLLLTNPLWSNLENVIVSPSIIDRARKVKFSILKTLQTDAMIHQLFNKIVSFHNVLLTHSINTMCASLGIGLALELTEMELHNLAFATLFADIGYTSMNLKGFKQMLDLDDRDKFVAEHIGHSISLIKDSPTCRNRELVMGILDHHEHFDGSGLPNGKKGEEISLFGRIIAISQAYDEAAGGYIQEHSLPVLGSQALIWAGRGAKWDDGILSAFVYRREFCKTGQEVVLANGHRGRIVGFRDFVGYPLHPSVRIGDAVLHFDSDEKLIGIKNVLR